MWFVGFAISENHMICFQRGPNGLMLADIQTDQSSLEEIFVNLVKENME